MFEVQVDRATLDAASSALQSGAADIEKGITRSVRQSAAYAKRQLGEFLPARTGILRKSYNQVNVSAYRSDVRSNLRYSGHIEDGKTLTNPIYPKRGKFLTIPLRDDVLTGTKSQIKKSALDNLFKKLKSRKKGQTNRQIFQEAGIVLARKVTKPRHIKATHIIRDRVVPLTTEYLTDRILEIIEKAVD